MSAPSSLEVLVAPAEEPVTLAEAKAFLRVGTDGDDTLIASLIVAAREAFEARTGRALVTRRVRQRWPGPIPAGRGLRAGAKPPSALVSLATLDAPGVETAASLDLARIEDNCIVASRAVQGLVAVYDAGHGGPETVPEAFRLAILEGVADAFARRDSEGGRGSNAWLAAFDTVRL
jgi:uncharacterized phiE125 gp8 family phage protein